MDSLMSLSISTSHMKPKSSPSIRISLLIMLKVIAGTIGFTKTRGGKGESCIRTYVGRGVQNLAIKIFATLVLKCLGLLAKSKVILSVLGSRLLHSSILL